MSKSSQRRVVITGLGVVSSIGIGWQEFWKNLLAGKSGITEVDYIDASQYDRKYAGQVKNFYPEEFISKSRLKYLGRASQMAIAASQMALKDAGLVLDDNVKKSTVVLIGATMAEMGILEGHHDRKMQSKTSKEKSAVFAYPANSVGANVALELNLGGFNAVVGNACCSGNTATGYAYDLIRAGRCDYAFVGGTDCFSRVVFTGFGRLIAIAPKKCQPFDKNRQGMIPAEGSGVLFLETYENAKKRKAHIYAEILGYGCSADAFHMTQPDSKGIEKSIRKAVENSSIAPDQVGYILAHGTGTPENDKAECLAFKNIFANYLKDIPVSSIKSMLGHTLGAASALESIACCLAIQDNKVPPTINYETPDPDCDIDCVPNEFRKHNVEVVLNNASAFGGNNCCLVLRESI